MNRPVMSALQLGQAPAYWARDLARLNAPLKALPRACAWVAGFAAANYRLLDQPLLGSCLAQLLAGDNRSGKAAMPVARSTRPRQGESVHPAPKRRFSNDLFASPDETPLRPRISPLRGAAESREKKMRMTGVPRFADTAQLHRLAGTMTMPAGKNPSGKWHEPLWAPRRKLHRFQDADRRIRPDIFALDGWRERLASRAIAVLRRSAPSRMPPWELPSPTTSEGTVAPPLQPWGASLSGPRVGAEVLAGIVQDARNQIAATKRGREDVSAQARPGKSFQEPAAAAGGAVAEPAPFRRFVQDRNRDLTGHGGGSNADHGTPGEAPTSQARLGNGATDIGTAPDAPRTYRDALSFLRKAKGPVPAIAAETARQPMLTESAAAANDPDRLAAMIKDILDEQARRHGIDV